MPEAGGYLDKKAFYSRVLTVYGRKPTLEALREIGVDYAQGFSIARPKPIE